MMKNIVLVGVVATLMVAVLATPALAEVVRDHRHDGSSSNSSVGGIADPPPVVRDPGKDTNQGIIIDPVRPPADDNADAPKDQKTTTAPNDAPGQLANNGGEIHGCPYSYNYEPDMLGGVCFPSINDLNFYPVLFGQKPWPKTVGAGVSMLGGVPGDLFQLIGVSWGAGGAGLDGVLSNWGDQIGGPAGDTVKVLGTIVSTPIEVAGAAWEGLGKVVEDTSGLVGATVNGVVSTAEDAWDEVSSWF